MTKKVFGIAGLMLVCAVFTGCTSLKNYSIRSYQGPLPINDHQSVAMDTYGVPTTPR